METKFPDSSDFALHVYRTQNICDNTLDDAQLEPWCPLHNGRHDCTPISIAYPQVLTEVLLRLGIPSFDSLRGLNCRAMELVNSVRQYITIIEHCPNIIRAIVSIQADAFDCGTLYRTLYCRRVCYFCFTRRAEYFPLTSREASKFFTPDARPQSNAKSFRKLLELAKPPSILSLPGVLQSLAGSGLPQSDETTTEPKRHMTIISAPVLLDAGRQVDHGVFCLGCRDELDENTKHFRIKYMREDMSEHIARYGRVKRTMRIPGEFMHVKKDQFPGFSLIPNPL
ncbi:hypothetical protein FPV67DRAFT_1567466 [Lyophyllum atratum]|nr:hypothetical protein FPV67DRAFT_1567466 [Lyophyllum atratum]